MFTDLATIRAAVEDRLTPELPVKWRIENTVDTSLKALVPVLYLEFTRVSTTVSGEALGRGQVSASFNVIITDPKTDTAKAEDDVDAHLMKILSVLDSFDDIYWDAAEKRRLPEGQLAWVITAFALAQTPTD